MRLAFSLSGRPQGKERPRVSSSGEFAHLYTPSRTVAYEKRVKDAGKKALGERPVLDEPLIVAVRVRLCPAKSISKPKRAAMLAAPHTACQSPDADNVVKTVLDGMNKVVFRDDVLITKLIAEKVWAETPGVDVVVSTYPERV